jgi:hypothetical protein
LFVAAAGFVLPLPALLIGQPPTMASFRLGSTFTWALLAVWITSLRAGSALPVLCST